MFCGSSNSKSSKQGTLSMIADFFVMDNFQVFLLLRNDVVDVDVWFGLFLVWAFLFNNLPNLTLFSKLQTFLIFTLIYFLSLSLDLCCVASTHFLCVWKIFVLVFGAPFLMLLVFRGWSEAFGWLYLFIILLLLFISLVLMVWLTIDFCRALWVFFLLYILCVQRALTVANSQWFFVVLLFCYLSTTHDSLAFLYRMLIVVFLIVV